MNSNIMSKIEKKNKAYTQFLNSRDGKDYKEYTDARNQAKWESKKAVENFEKELAKLAKTKQKHFINTPAVKQKLDKVYPTWRNLTEP